MTKQKDEKQRKITIFALTLATIVSLALSIGAKALVSRSKYAVAGKGKEITVDGQSAANGIKEAYLYADGSYLVSCVTEGFASEVVLNIYVEADKTTLRGVELVSQNESQGYGAKIATDKNILLQFEEKTLPVYADGAEDLWISKPETGAEQKPLADGTYKAEAEAGGYLDVVELTIENGKIVAAKYESYDKDGNAKSKLAAEGVYVMTENGLTWDKQAEKIAAYVLEHQGISMLPVAENGKTDAIAGVSVAVSGTVALFEACLNEAAGVAEAAPVGTKVDGISGATVTTRAMIADINKVYTFLQGLAEN